MTLEETKILKPGDVVVCNTQGLYCVTDFGVPCYFKKITNEGLILVEVASGIYRGAQFEVKAEAFDFDKQKDVFDRRKDISESELMRLLC